MLRSLLFVTLFLMSGTCDAQPSPGDQANPGNQTNISPLAQDAIYRLRIDADARRIVHVDAELPIAGRVITIGENHPQPQQERWGDYVDDLEITDLDGTPIPWSRSGDNRWSLSGTLPERIRARYQLRLEHDQVAWPPSHAEATYVRDDCVFFRTFAVLLGTQAMERGYVLLDVPEDWKITTPLSLVEGQSHERLASTRFDVFVTGLMLGTHQTGQVEVGQISLDLGVAQDLPGAIDAMVGPFEEALEEAMLIFGGAPASRYGILAARNQRSGQSGSGLGNGMAVLLGRNPSDDPGGYWAYTFVHELLHMWTGGAIRNRDSREEEWFSEGMSDYLTVVIAGRRGVLRQNLLLFHMGQMWGGYLALVGERSMSVAGNEKSRFYNLIYGGGLHVGLLLDLELRRATGGERRIDDLMQALYTDFGLTGKNVTSHDVERIASQIAGEDLAWIFERFVRGTEALTPDLVYTPLGLRLEQNSQQRTVLKIDPEASPKARALRLQILGIE